MYVYSKNNETLKVVAECSSSNHKEYKRTGDFMACGSINSVLRSVNFI